MKIKERVFYIKNIDTKTTVEVVNKRKDIFDYIEDFIYNLQYDWYDSDNESYSILYKDGTTDYINSDYDGHKIKRQNVISMIYTNAETDIVYGNFKINEHGVVTTSDKEIISKGIEELV